MARATRQELYQREVEIREYLKAEEKVPVP